KKEQENIIPPDVVEIDVNLPTALTGQHNISYLSYNYNTPDSGSDQGFIEVFPIGITVLSPSSLRLEMTLGQLKINNELEVIYASYNHRSQITSLNCTGKDKINAELTYSIVDGKVMFRTIHYSQKFTSQGEYIYASNIPMTITSRK
ncbi:MAG: hypothetical protein K8F30_09170, partial [Taibaiella sp.]|nr:hypothetical protein [Taibaiella sp.]